MTRSKIRTSGAEGITLSSTSLTVANGLTLTDGDVTVASGHGVTFAATSDASGQSSELLDDYEEGTWTPVASTNAGTLSNESGVYVKIGRVVFIGCFISFTGASTSGNRTYSGLPFTVSDTFPFTSVDYHATSWSSHYGRALFTGGTTTVIDNVSAVTAGSFGADNSVRIQGFYLTDS
tara:strand:+ start:69 stop:602 length:534 start_codon:yes stop_codon:yes gene_type:complete